MMPSSLATVAVLAGVSILAACHSAAQAQPPQTGGSRPPYRIGAMTIPNGAVSLTATATVPEGPGPFPALIIAGATEMSATIADGLTRRRIVVLRADARSEDVVRAMVTQVKTIPGVDSARIGVVGFGPDVQAFLSRLTVPVYTGTGEATPEALIGPLATWVFSLK